MFILNDMTLVQSGRNRNFYYEIKKNKNKIKFLLGNKPHLPENFPDSCTKVYCYFTISWQILENGDLIFAHVKQHHNY